jgi:dihydroorotase
MIRRAKKEGLRLTCEVTPHHLFGYDDDYRVNPPLRGQGGYTSPVEGLRDGTVDCLATDHAPHTPEDKAAGMAGISNIEYAVQIFLQVFHDNGIPLTRLSELTSFNRRAGWAEKRACWRRDTRRGRVILERTANTLSAAPT